ncbi:serine hydrolase [Methanosarcina acetivorans]|nr:serine hydrolase [Methanosarcina acetivorans]
MNEGELEGKKVLSPSLIRELSTPRTPVPSGYDNGSYGYGLYLYEHRGVDVVGHKGGLEGFTCQFLMVPEHLFAVIVMTNTYGSELHESIEQAMELFLPLDTETPADRPEDTETVASFPISEEEMASYEGSYFNTPNLSLELVGKDGQIFLKLGELETPVKKVGEHRFATYHPLTQQPVEFVLVPGEDGKTAYLCI